MLGHEAEIGSIPYRPLGLVKDVLEQVGAEVSYVYEDLIFITHNHFLLQFGKSGEVLFFYANEDMKGEDSGVQYDILSQTAGNKGVRLIDRGLYRLSQDKGEKLSLEFIPCESATPMQDLGAAAEHS